VAKKKWNNKNSWANPHTATNVTIRVATSLDNARASGSYGGKSKGIGGGYGGMDALTAVQNICDAHGVDVAGWVADYYDDEFFKAMAVQLLGLEGIPWENGIYDKDHDGIDFEEEVEAMMALIPDMIAEQWLSGDLYMPQEFCDYCFYEVSDHNK
jgi:hypothetical protein